jgi:Predicted amino acid racemase
LPTREKLEDFVGFRDMFSRAIGHELPVVSIGGTCCLKAIEEGWMPHEVNQLRICEGVVLGRDTANMREIPYLEREAIVVSAEVVECRDKPSVPNGEVGLQAFGEKPVFIDRGMRRRALLAAGRQDVSVEWLTPLEEGVHIVTASSDHMIVDVTETKETVAAGDILHFRPHYPAMLAAATSRYVMVEFE